MDLTLNERLTALGFATRSAGGYRKDILNAYGCVVFTGTAHDVAGWIRRGCTS